MGPWPRIFSVISSLAFRVVPYVLACVLAILPAPSRAGYDDAVSLASGSHAADGNHDPARTPCGAEATGGCAMAFCHVVLPAETAGASAQDVVPRYQTDAAWNRASRDADVRAPPPRHRS